MCVAVALDHLVGNPRDLQPQPRADPVLHGGRDGGVGADGARNLANAYSLESGFQPFPLPVHLVPPECQLQAHRHGFGVHPVGTPHHERVLVLQGPGGEGTDGPVHFFQQDPPRLHQLQVQPGVQHIAGGQAQVKPPALGPEVTGNGRNEGRYVVAGCAEDLVHSLRVILRDAQADHVLLRDHTLFAPCLAYCQLNGQPLFVLVIVGPDPLHCGTGVSVNHSLGPVR